MSAISSSQVPKLISIIDYGIWNIYEFYAES